MKKSMQYLVTILLSFITLLLYGTLIEPKKYWLKCLDMSASKQKKIKIAHISDIQISRGNKIPQLKKIVDSINKENVDFIFFTGDLFENLAEYMPLTYIGQHLKALRASYGKFAVLGNHDYFANSQAKTVSILKHVGFDVLINESEIFNIKGRTFFIGGLDDSLMVTSDMRAILEKKISNRSLYSIILTHEPDIADDIKRYEPNLILVGHSHGGQINLSFLTVKNKLAEKYIEGPYKLSDNNFLYVNSGIGTARLFVRFGVKPEVTIIKI